MQARVATCELKKIPQRHRLVDWLIVMMIYVALAIFQLYRNLEAGDNQTLKSKRRDLESNPGTLAPQAKSLKRLHHRFS